MGHAPSVCCTSRDGRIVAYRDALFGTVEGPRALSVELSLSDLLVLERFVHAPEPEAVYRALQDESNAVAASTIRDLLGRNARASALIAEPGAMVFLGSNRLVAAPLSAKALTFNTADIIDLTPMSRKAPSVAAAILSPEEDRNGGIHVAPPSRPAFLGQVDRLVGEGFLVPEIGRIHWGDLRRRHPFCQTFGYTRGTPIDRYYLRRFLAGHRDRIQGRVLEIGGKLPNREMYGFAHATEYRTLELAGIADDLEGDAADPNAVPRHSFDVIIALHVLEHCPRPQIVIDNIANWLAPNGLAVVAVPGAQKIHAFPGDYWRIQPDGMAQLFSSWRNVSVESYGTLAAAIASLSGVAAEELSDTDLEPGHPDYPVLICATAQN